MPKKLSLIIAIVIPFFMIAYVTSNILLTRAHLVSKENFLYMIMDNSTRDCSEYVKSQLFPHYKPINKPYAYCLSKNMHLYIYDMKIDKSKIISLNDAKKLKLNPQPISTEGYHVSVNFNYARYWSWWSIPQSETNVYLVNQQQQKLLNIHLAEKYNHFFIFLAWIKE
jgi:hypothetical protein